MAQKSKANLGFNRLMMGDDKATRFDAFAQAITHMPDEACHGLVFIFRFYDAPDRANLARQLAHLCRRRQIIFSVAGDLTLAKNIGADGVHFQQYQQQEPLPEGFSPITRAVHDMDAIKNALPADALIASPVFATPSHPQAACLGVEKFETLCHASAMPVFALGGINTKTAATLSGAAGIAGISCFLIKE